MALALSGSKGEDILLIIMNFILNNDELHANNDEFHT